MAAAIFMEIFMKKLVLFLLSVALVSCFAGFSALNVKADGYSLKDELWIDSDKVQLAPADEGEFTVALIGDTQKAVEYYPETVKESMRWLVEQKSALNLKYLISMGDIVDDVDKELDSRADPDKQLTDARAAYDILADGNVPFVLTLGNHDYEDMAFSDRISDKFNEYFPLSVYDGLPEFGGAYGDTVENTYHFFENGNQKYMILSLGHNPTDEMLAWANRIVSENSDRKVIVVVHAYINGGENAKDETTEFSSGGYGQRNPQGDKIWNNLLRKHENIFMVTCGHELALDNKRVVRSRVYGDNGNVIDQFMTNPADIEYGGGGLIVLLTFRNDATVDSRYYAPAFDKYYGKNNQFSYSLASDLPENQAACKVSANEISGNLNENFLSYDSESEDYVKNAYSFAGVQLTQKGVAPAENGANLVYKFGAANGEEFSKMKISVSYSSSSQNGGIAVALSADGENYTVYGSSDGVSQSARAEGSGYKACFTVSDEIYGNKTVYVKLMFLNASENNIAVSAIDVITKSVVAVVNDAGTFGFSENFADYAKWDLTGVWNNAVKVFDLALFEGYLGTGRSGDYAGAKGYAEWDFIAPEGSTIQTLYINATGRMGKRDSTIEHPYAMKISYSFDRGESYTDFATEKVSSKGTFNYDLSNCVNGRTEVRIRLTLWGDYWHTTALKTLSITGNYGFNVEYFAGDGIASLNNPSHYVTTDTDILLENATAPNYYTFDGWYDNEDFSGKKFTKIPAGYYGNLKLYAKYIPKTHVIEYILNGGSNANNADFYTEKDGYTLQNAARTGYTFAGWYKNADFSGEQVLSIPAGSTTDVTLYAKFLKNYKVVYVLGGGTLEDKIETVTEEDEIILSEPVRSGYEFLGWYTDRNYTTGIEKIEKGTNKSITLFAKWKKAENGGQSSPSDSSDSSAKSCKSNISSNAFVCFIALAFVCIGGRKVFSKNRKN